MNKTILLTGIIFGFLAIILGAFAAHGLENKLPETAITSFDTGVKYQMYHALFLLLLAQMNHLSETQKKWVYFLVVNGVILFSFSIYGLATNALTSFDFRSIGFITPIGGVLLITAWGLLGFQSLRNYT